MEGISIIPKELIAQFLPDNPIILEAGAHIGRDTLKMARFWPDGHVYAFEPAAYLFKELKENVAQQQNVSCYQYALSDEVGTQMMYVSQPPFGASSSLFEPTGYIDEHPEAIFSQQEVKTTTIDHWARENKIDRIDFMWLDMQGAELRALEGGLKMLENVRVVQAEVSLTERYLHTPLYDDVRTWLEQHGFDVAQEALHKGHWGNVLFVRS